MKRKTYNNVLKAARLIRKKGYEQKESLEIAVQKFDELKAMHNGMTVEWLIDKMANKEKRSRIAVAKSEKSLYTYTVAARK